MARKKYRGNGQGTVYREGDTWTAEKTFGYYLEDGVKKREFVKKRGFRTKTAAVMYLPQLESARRKPRAINPHISFGNLALLCLEELERRELTQSTLNCYRAALKHFHDVVPFTFREIGIEDLQSCLDDCPCGKRTRENMKAFCGLVYKYAIPRGYSKDNLNLAQYLRVSGEGGGEKAPFTMTELEIFRSNIGIVPYADYIYAMCYLGFRPGELFALTLDSYDEKEKSFVGGAKTEAGKNRIVTISPKIQPIIDRLSKTTIDGHIFHHDGRRMEPSTFRKKFFYPALEQMGIPNEDPKRTPHSCRHTFANLLKNVDAADKDKMKLIGHSSEEMLRYYQSSDLQDLRRITDCI